MKFVKKYCNCLYPVVAYVYVGKYAHQYKDTMCDLPMYDQEKCWQEDIYKDKRKPDISSTNKCK